MSPVSAAALFAVSLVVTLVAAGLFARRLDRLGVRFGLPEAVVGLLTALAADGPEVSSALVALVKGAHDVSVGVLVGSNVFNLAAMLGVSAILAGSVRLPREALLLEGLIGAAVTLVTAAVLLRWLAPVVATLLLACILVPYALLLICGPRLLERLPQVGRLPAGLELAPAQRDPPDRPPDTSSRPTHHLLALIALDVTLIVAGSIGMVETALTLSSHWQIARPVLGVLILAPLTSLPNAVTAVRLGLAHRGSALVGETLNSNTINLTAGVAVPALFVTLASPSLTVKIDIGWLTAMTALTLVLLARPAGMRRGGAAVLICLYLGFVAVQLVSA